MGIDRLKSTAAVAAIALVSFVGSIETAQAQGVPTYDVSSVAELIALVNTNREMLGIDGEILTNATNQLAQLQEQLRQARATHNALTGARGTISNLFNGDITPRKLSTSLTALTTTGKAVNRRLSNHIESLTTEFQPLTGLQVLGRTNPDPLTKSHDLVSGSSMAGLAIAEEGFAGAGEAMHRYDSYRTQIAATDDLKASVDLNTRIAIENGMMLATLLQTLSAQGQLEAALVNQRLRDQDILARQAYRPEGSN